MDKLETNIINSFRRVREEILELKDQILRLAEKQEKIEVLVDELRSKAVKKGSRKDND